MLGLVGTVGLDRHAAHGIAVRDGGTCRVWVRRAGHGGIPFTCWHRSVGWLTSG
ncbi:hypothetical protein SF06_24610 [Pseudomonas flexibilis]|nr:hypothetical protein SF06_24610 [Pseudomonas flexibilis]